MRDQSVPWIKWEFAHWLGGKISRRPAIEQAVFINLQALIMKEGGPIELPDEDRLDMADRLHVDADAIDKAIDNLSARKIIENVKGSFFMIKFLGEKMKSVEDIRERRKLAGAKGGLAKASKNLASATDNLASATPSLAKPTREGEGVIEGGREREYGLSLPDIGNTSEPMLFRQFEAEWKKSSTGLWNTNTTRQRWNEAISAGHDPAMLIESIANSTKVAGNKAQGFSVGGSAKWLEEKAWEDQLTAAEIKAMTSDEGQTTGARQTGANSWEV